MHTWKHIFLVKNKNSVFLPKRHSMGREDDIITLVEIHENARIHGQEKQAFKSLWN